LFEGRRVSPETAQPGEAKEHALSLRISQRQRKPRQIYFGTASTIVKDRKKELGAGLLHQMCKDLGIRPEDL